MTFAIALFLLPNIAPTFGHVGDGNLHVNIFFNLDNEELLRMSGQAANKLAKKAISLGGTCTGEHGVGLGKRHLLQHQFGPEGMNAMKLIKKALDPYNIMNPGKVL